MNYLHILLLTAAAAASGCYAGPNPPPEAGQPLAETPPPVVSHALTGDAPAPPAALEKAPESDAGQPAGSAHHAEPPLVAPNIDPPAPATEAALRAITIPAGTVLSLQLGSTVSSRASNIEDAVDATVRRAVVIDGVTVVPAGSAVTGYVTEAEPSGKVKGRARVGVRFNALRVAGTRYHIRTASISREARGTKKVDAARIGVGAGAGAIVGAIAGGKKGAAVGTAVGAAGGTGVVLATAGEEVSMGRGTVIAARLSEAVIVRVR